MNDHITIAVLAGTTRVQRQSIHAARYIAEYGKNLQNVTIIFVDPADLHFEGDGNDPEGKNAQYTSITEQADAFFVLTPEYNYSFPGSLKRMLDSELANYLHKPVAIGGASSGPWGGVRAVESLVTAVREMGLVVTSISPYFPHVQDMFDSQGVLKVEYKERTDRNLEKAFNELLWMAKTLKHGRNNIS